jgi:GMP synthase-like glutamine amidotransferase
MESVRILVIEHHDTPSLGIVGETLEAEGVATRVLWGEDGDPMPEDTQGFDGMIVLGGAMNALDDERCPYFPDLLSLIRQFHIREKPMMGICLGAQLIARAFGGRAHLDGPFEFGFHPIDLTAQGRQDPVLGHMADGLHLFEWHTDHYELPGSATRLATGRDYHNQAYRIGRFTYAMQFHLEVTRPLVEGWIDNYAVEEMESRAPGYSEWLPGQFEDYLRGSTAFCRETTRRWLDLCR